EREYSGTAEADFESAYEMSYAPAVLWQYFVDADKRVRWQPNTKVLDTQRNQLGRLGAGAASHCAHGLGPDALREYLDWRPYTYFTCRFTPVRPTPLFIAGVETTEFVPTDDRTTIVRLRFRADDRGRLARARVRSFAVLYRAIARRAEQRCREIMREDGFLEWSEGDDHAG